MNYQVEMDGEYSSPQVVEFWGSTETCGKSLDFRIVTFAVLPHATSKGLAKEATAIFTSLMMEGFEGSWVHLSEEVDDAEKAIPFAGEVAEQFFPQDDEISCLVSQGGLDAKGRLCYEPLDAPFKLVSDGKSYVGADCFYYGVTQVPLKDGFPSDPVCAA